ncbi:MAG: hypothetical protein LH472_11730 [Pyrinomonadaceae bacterium]|nr:hypothetical protein [Pyrinomonadaceae bacterium]
MFIEKKYLVKIGVIVSAVAVGLVFLGAFFYFGVFYFFYTTVENWITARLGLDYYPAQLLTTIAVVGLTALFPTLAWYLIFGKQKFYGTLALIGVQAAICVSVYTIGGKVCFDRRTGKSLCYFADTPKGRVWSYTPGFEPESGTQFQIYTREIEAEKVKSKK